MLGVLTRTLRRREQHGIIHSVKVGKLVLVGGLCLFVMVTTVWLFRPHTVAAAWVIPYGQVLGTTDGTAPTEPKPSWWQKLVSPITQVSQNVTKQITSAIHEQVTNQFSPANTNNFLTLRKDNTLELACPLTILNSSFLRILDQGVINRLNAQFVQGRKPGTQPGDLVTLNNQSKIPNSLIDSTIITQSIADGSITPDALSASTKELFSLQPNSVGRDILKDNAVDSSIIKNGSITAADLADSSITSGLIKDGEVAADDLANSGVTTSKLADEAITSAKIATNTITADDLASALSFSSGDFLDLSAITYSSTAVQGLRLPNAASNTPSNPASGEG